MVKQIELFGQAEQRNPVLHSFAGITGRTGLLGGSFDPPHLGHVHAARCLIDALALERCVMIPTHRNPLKSEAPVAGDHDRLQMLVRALAPHPDLLVSPMELRTDDEARSSYTVDTLARIREELGGGPELLFFIGSDLLATLDGWRDLGRIATLATLVLYPRAGYPIDRAALNAARLPPAIIAMLRAHIVEIPPVELSATGVRAAIAAQGAAASKMLAPTVAEYIDAHGLYRQVAPPEQMR